MNHLALEKTPYLQQHSANPVDWYPWGEVAFAKAREENKPVFLSIGYSTCHWCHVMARESFSNPEIAAVMNGRFVNIKVDREERPDVDQVYMTFVQASTGAGGWPMSVWLTPDLKPIFGGTYFPPGNSMGRPGFKRVLEQIADEWENNEYGIRIQAGRMTEQLRMIATGSDQPANELPAEDGSMMAFEQISESYDAVYGGFGHAPKFPRPVIHNFLYHIARLQGSGSLSGAKAISMSAETLRKMAEGGIYDHLGGGFHRYSVDRFWHIPHYEKMLYDQAQLVVAYLDAARLTDDPFFIETARDILAYVTRCMTHPCGGFYSAEDADSMESPDATQKSEGAYYIWRKWDIGSLLGDKASLFNYVYGVEDGGNAPQGSDPHGDLAGTNTLIRRYGDAEVAKHFSMSSDEVTHCLADARRILYEARGKRPSPHLDDKILTAWNGLMISAFARAYQSTADPSYLEISTRAADFIYKNLHDTKRGILLRSYRDGPSEIEGLAADYAFLIQGLLDLYQAGFDIRWLRWADALQIRQDELFEDERGGGYFASTKTATDILLRVKDAFDGAEPSENSISTLNLLRLGAMLDQPERREKAVRILRTFAPQIIRNPDSMPQMLVALQNARSNPAQIIIAGDLRASDTQQMIDIARVCSDPHHVILVADAGEGQEYLASHSDIYRAHTAIGGKATAYVCENFVCQLPTNDPAKLEEMLSRG